MRDLAVVMSERVSSELDHIRRERDWDEERQRDSRAIRFGEQGQRSVAGEHSVRTRGPALLLRALLTQRGAGLETCSATRAHAIDANAVRRHVAMNRDVKP